MKMRQKPHKSSTNLPDSSPSSFTHQNKLMSSDLWTIKDAGGYTKYSNRDNPHIFIAGTTFNEEIYAKRNVTKEVSVLFNRIYSMQSVMKPYLLLGQCFGLIPVCGIFSDDPRDLRFKWRTRRTLYALVTVIVVLVLSIIQIVKSIRLQGLSHSTADVIVGHVVYTTTVIIFIFQACSWRKLIIVWTKIEHQMKHIRPVLNLESKTTHLVIVFSICTLLLILVRIIGTMATLSPCSEDWTVLLQLAIILKYLSLFSIIKYSVFKAAATFILFLHENVVAVYDELTIILLAYCLRERFKQLRIHLLSLKHQKLPSAYWVQMRVTYNNLSSLGKLLDAHLSCMTLVCFGGNLYLICSLLLLSLKSENNKLINWCLFYVLSFLIGRTYTAALFAASVYEESKKPLALLFSVPSDSYNAEVCRFQMQVTHDEITITGCHFFSLTRSFMLTVAGTIMTYEIVLLQFGSLGENIETSFNKSMCTPLMDTLNLNPQ